MENDLSWESIAKGFVMLGGFAIFIVIAVMIIKWIHRE